LGILLSDLQKFLVEHVLNEDSCSRDKVGSLYELTFRYCAIEHKR